MNLNQLRTLIAIADGPSFVAAADRLFITPSAISHQMRELEAELGNELFDRSTRPPQLNAHGQAVVARGREVLRDFDLLVETARSPGEMAGTLKLGCINGISSDLITQALINLRATHPAVQIRIDEGVSGVLAERVVRRDLDAAIISEMINPDPGLKFLPIARDSLFVVAPAGSQGSDWRTLLEAHPFIRLNRLSSMGALIERTIRDADMDLREIMELDSTDVVLNMVRAGLGVGVVPAVRLNHVPVGAVVVAPFGDPPVHRRVVLAERRRSTQTDLSGLVYNELKRLTEQPGELLVN